MKCPSCGNRGSRDDEAHFEVRGQVDGTPIRRCRQCGIGLSVGVLGRARVIPDEIWMKMDAEWLRTFPADDPQGAVNHALREYVGGKPDAAALITQTDDEFRESAAEWSDVELGSFERILRLHSAESERRDALLQILQAEQERRGLEPWSAGYRPPGGAG